MSENFDNLNWGQSEREDWSFSPMANRQQYYKCLWSGETKSRNPTPCTETQGVKLARTAANSRKISGVNMMLTGTKHNNNAGWTMRAGLFLRLMWAEQERFALRPLGVEGGGVTHIFLLENGLVWVSFQPAGCPPPPKKGGRRLGGHFLKQNRGKSVLLRVDVKCWINYRTKSDNWSEGFNQKKMIRGV